MKLGKDHYVLPHQCLACGRALDGAQGLDTNALPDPGDISICGYCGHVAIFAEDGQLRFVADEEMPEVTRNLELLRKAEFQ